jgi:ComEC/Rec2-related protein
VIRLSLAAIPSIALRYPIKKWAAVGAMLGALGYLLISGAAFATVRSYIMISIMFLAVLLDRPAVALRNVALAALAILVVWPESLFDPGFQMSFAAVVALVSAYEWIRARQQERPDGFRRGPIAHLLLFLGGIMTSTLVASLSVAPFGIYHFHNTQQFAIIANLVAIPICNLLVMPAALAALCAMPFGLEAVPLWVMGIGIEAMAWCAAKVAALPDAVGRVPAIPTAAFAAMLVGGLWCTLWGTRWRLLGIAPIVLGLMLAPTGRRPDLLVGRGADLVAVRGDDGTLSALAGRGGGLRADTLAGARRRPPLAGRGRQGARLPLRRRGLYGAREGADTGGSGHRFGLARRLCEQRHPDPQDGKAVWLCAKRHRHRGSRCRAARHACPLHRRRACAHRDGCFPTRQPAVVDAFRSGRGRYARRGGLAPARPARAVTPRTLDTGGR